MSLSKKLYPLLSIGSTQEDRKLSRHHCKIVNWNVKHQNKLTHVKRTKFSCAGSNVLSLQLKLTVTGHIQNQYILRDMLKTLC